MWKITSVVSRLVDLQKKYIHALRSTNNAQKRDRHKNMAKSTKFNIFADKGLKPPQYGFFERLNIIV